jgi:hypothetical protein
MIGDPHELPSADRDAIYVKISAAVPGFADLQAKTTRAIPLFELKPPG